MANEVKILGDTLVISIYDGAAYRPVACLTGNSISSVREILESRTKCDPGVVKKDYGPLNQSASVEGECIDTTSVGGYTSLASFDYLKTVQQAGNKVDMRFSTGLADTPSEYATVLIENLQQSGPTGQISTFTADFQFDTILSDTDPNP